MLTFIFTGVARTVFFVGRYAPSLRLRGRILRRDGLKWGVPAMLLAVPYYLAAEFFRMLLDEGWNSLFALPLIWCLAIGTMFVCLGPVSLLKLLATRVAEARARAAAQRRADLLRNRKASEATKWSS